ncbi:hypothetical protein F4859DRAFT_486744 [Xylaria cf. heliscus]|nr:hypothetical protein F4859DRAFT_486744 [Xylaria cf. heliscus]
MLLGSNAKLPSAIHMAKQEETHEELPRYISQDSRANSQSGPSPTNVDLEDLIGIVLDQRFRIGERLHEEGRNNHYVAFAVHQDDTKSRHGTDEADRLVARIYDMNELTPKHKRYMIRNISRSAARTLFKTTWNSCQIIILRLGRLDNPRSSLGTKASRYDIASRNPKRNNEQGHLHLSTSETRVASVDNDELLDSAPMDSNTASLQHSPKPKAKTKTNYQRESSRLRQRDRRAAKRSQQRSIANGVRAELDLQPRPFSETLALKENPHGIDDITFAMLVMLHFAFNRRTELKTRLSPATRSQIEKFLSARSAKLILSNDDEKSEFLQVKENELVWLRRLTKKLSGVTQQCHDELLGLLEEQRSTTKGSAQWDSLQVRFIDPRKNWYRVLISASKVLPMLMTESEELISSLRTELREANEMKEKRRILNHKEWIHHLIPASETYNQLFGTLKYSESPWLFPDPISA